MASPPLTTLGNCIHYVLPVGSKPEMIRVNTRSAVLARTIMENTFSFWHGTVVDKPRRDVRPDRLPSLIPPLSNVAVPVIIKVSRPQPARRRLVHLCEKSITEGCRESLGQRGVLSDVPVIWKVHISQSVCSIPINFRVNSIVRESQVLRPCTQGIAASKHHVSCRKCADVNQPGKGACADVSGTGPTSPNDPAAVAAASLPKPTPVRFLDVLEKPPYAGEGYFLSGENGVRVNGDVGSSVAFPRKDDSFFLHDNFGLTIRCCAKPRSAKTRGTPLLSHEPIAQST